MPRTGTSLRLRKTLRASTSTTFNAPGNYLPPYGSTVIRVGGRGASGNPNVPGNFVPGNVSGHNPGSPGNVSGNNPPSVDTHNYGVWNSHCTAQVQFFPGPPGQAPRSVPYSTTVSGPWPGFLAHSIPGPGPHGPFFFGDAAPPYGYSQTGTTFTSCQPANFNGNPNFIPGNPNFNPYVPGNPNFNPNTTNPSTPGNAGSPASILGVSFPGGAIGSTAPTVPQTATTTVYTGSSISITVPSGGFVTIDNV